MEYSQELGYLKGKVESLYLIVKEHMEKEEQDRQETKAALKELSDQVKQIEGEVRGANIVYKTVRACAVFFLGVLAMGWDEAIRALKGVM